MSLLNLPNAANGPFLPFVRMHQLNSDLHIANVRQPCSEYEFMTICRDYAGRMLELLPYPSARHPEISEHVCEHPRHPIVQEGLWTLQPSYDIGTLCPVCSIRFYLYIVRVVKDMWVRNTDRKANSYKYNALKKCWHRVKSFVMKEYCDLQAMADIEKQWESANPEHNITNYWSACAAIAIYDYAEADRAPPMGPRLILRPIPTSNSAGEIKTEPMSDAKPQKTVTFDNSVPDIPPTKRDSLTFYRPNIRYTPGRHACSDPAGWENTSFAGVTFYGINKGWWQFRSAEGHIMWGKNIIIREDTKDLSIEEQCCLAMDMQFLSIVDMTNRDLEGRFLEGFGPGGAQLEQDEEAHFFVTPAVDFLDPHDEDVLLKEVMEGEYVVPA